MSTDISIAHPTDRPNFSRVFIGPVTLGFSYQTLVHVNGPAGYATIQNYWGPTTGKHLNEFDYGRKAERLDNEDFQKVVEANLAALGSALVTA